MKVFLLFFGIFILLSWGACKHHFEQVSYYDDAKTQIRERITVYAKKRTDGVTEHVLDGSYKVWYPDGVLQTEGFFVEGEPMGDFITWWPNGRVRVKNHHGKQGCDGKQFVYHIDGTLLKEYEMKNGTGIEYMFHVNGNLRHEISWKNGVLDGIKKNYDQDGKLISTQLYSQGELVSTTEIKSDNP